MVDSKNMSSYGQKKSFDDDPVEVNSDLQMQKLKEAIAEYKLDKQQRLQDQIDDENLTEQVTNSYNDEDNDLYEQNIRQKALQQIRDNAKLNRTGLYGE
jgi:hypothetical protein